MPESLCEVAYALAQGGSCNMCFNTVAKSKCNTELAACQADSMGCALLNTCVATAANQALAAKCFNGSYTKAQIDLYLSALMCIDTYCGGQCTTNPHQPCPGGIGAGGAGGADLDAGDGGG